MSGSHVRLEAGVGKRAGQEPYPSGTDLGCGACERRAAVPSARDGLNTNFIP